MHNYSVYRIIRQTFHVFVLLIGIICMYGDLYSLVHGNVL